MQIAIGVGTIMRSAVRRKKGEKGPSGRRDGKGGCLDCSFMIDDFMDSVKYIRRLFVSRELT